MLRLRRHGRASKDRLLYPMKRADFGLMERVMNIITASPATNASRATKRWILRRRNTSRQADLRCAGNHIQSFVASLVEQYWLLDKPALPVRHPDWPHKGQPQFRQREGCYWGAMRHWDIRCVLASPGPTVPSKICGGAGEDVAEKNWACRPCTSTLSTITRPP